MIDLRERTYEILGLPLGSLANEGGRDWNEAEKEARAENTNDTIKENIVKYRSENLTDIEVLEFMQTNDKDMILHFIRTRKLTKEMLELAIRNNTYLVRKELEKRDLIKAMSKKLSPSNDIASVDGSISVK